MRFNLDLKIIGLFVVTRAGETDTHHRVVALNPDGVADVPDHDVYLSFDEDFLDSAAGIEPEKQDTQWRVKLPKRTIARFPEAIEEHLPYSTFDPVDLNALGLGKLKSGVGEGAWGPGEQGRALLPKANAHAGWTGDMGSWRFEALGGKVMQVACTFMWGGRFEDRFRIDLEHPEGVAHVTLKPGDRAPGDTVRLAYSCIEFPENGPATPFSYARAFAKLATEPWNGRHQPTVARRLHLLHAGSPSCPPIDG